ncbi:substrate-binding periplasmic protein [Desulfobotulus mexicanus]|nr:ABC transporter substrate-binding protein [Desulfobotulus mexicanus]
MKKIIFFISLYLCCTLSAFSEETVIKLAIGEYPPFTSEKELHGKLLEEVVSAAFGLEGIRVEYAYFPWARSIALTENGEYDGTFPWLKTADRMEIFHLHQDSLIQDEGVYFHLKTTTFDWSTLEDLKKYRVGVTLGYANVEIYEKAGIKAEAVPREELNFKKIAGNRIDVYQTSKTVGYYMMHSQKVSSHIL